MKLLWRPGETPVLLFAVSFQWLQVTAKVFHANVLGTDVTRLSAYGFSGTLPSVESAIWMALLGLLVLSLGIRLGLKKLGPMGEGEMQRQAFSLSTERAFLFYLGCTVVATVLGSAVWSVGGFIQIVRAALGLRWVGLFVLGYVALKRRERYPLFFVAVAIEFISGIGFFSGFKLALFVTLIVIFTVRYRLRSGTIAAGAFLFVVLLIFGASWTSVKEEYRAFLNQGTRSQATLVSRSDQFDKLAELVGELSWDDVAYSMGEMFERIAYVDFFALTMDYVPEYRPHEGGELWKNAIVHVLTPRAFFPSKPPLTPDSRITMRYTGLYLSGADEGTSISIGYMGESYIDFGPYGMYVPIFILGFLWGAIYTFFLKRSRLKVIGYAFATAALLNAYQFEITGIKLLGGALMEFVVLALIMRVSEPYIIRWLQKEGHTEYVPFGVPAGRES
jgi:hypothetical protein